MNRSNGLDPQYLRVEEVARLLRVSKMTVYRMCHGGELEFTKVRNSFRIPRKSFDQYVREHTS